MNDYKTLDANEAAAAVAYALNEVIAMSDSNATATMHRRPLGREASWTDTLSLHRQNDSEAIATSKDQTALREIQSARGLAHSKSFA